MELLEFLIFLIFNIVLIYLAIAYKGFIYNFLGLIMNLVVIPLFLSNGLVLDRTYIVNATAGMIKQTVITYADKTLILLIIICFTLIHSAYLIKIARG